MLSGLHWPGGFERPLNEGIERTSLVLLEVLEDRLAEGRNCDLRPSGRTIHGDEFAPVRIERADRGLNEAAIASRTHRVHECVRERPDVAVTNEGAEERGRVAGGEGVLLPCRDGITACEEKARRVASTSSGSSPRFSVSCAMSMFA